MDKFLKIVFGVDNNAGDCSDTPNKISSDKSTDESPDGENKDESAKEKSHDEVSTFFNTEAIKEAVKAKHEKQQRTLDQDFNILIEIICESIISATKDQFYEVVAENRIVIDYRLEHSYSGNLKLLNFEYEEKIRDAVNEKLSNFKMELQSFTVYTKFFGQSNQEKALYEKYTVIFKD